MPSVEGVRRVAAVVLGGLLVAGLGPATARAFTPSGHEGIEALAYRRVLARREVVPGVSGVEVIRFLIREQILDTPACFEPAPGSAEERECAEAYHRDPMQWWPVIRSGEPDNVMYRQFGSDGQCFHFMGRAEDVTGSEDDPATGIPIALHGEAYRRCLALLDELLVRTLYDPAAANVEMMGAYAMMHAIADSFSDGHVERDAEWRVVHLKVWRMRAWVRYLAAPGAFGHYFDDDTHHAAVFEDDDDAWIREAEVGGRDCAEYGAQHPQSLPEACFTERARRAARAIEDLLVILYRLRRRQVEGDDALDARTDAAWGAYRDRHLPFAAEASHDAEEAPRGSAPPPDPRRAREILVDPVRPLNIGLQWEREWSTRADSVFLMERALPLRPRQFSVINFVSPAFGVGVRRVQDRTQLALAFDLALWLPVSGMVHLACIPLSARGTIDADDSHLGLGAVPVRIDVFPARWLWIGVTPARLELWRDSGDSGWSSALTLGVALDRSPITPLVRGYETIVVESESHAIGEPASARAEGNEPPRGVEPWRPPPEPTIAWRDPDPTLLALSAGTTLLARSDGNACAMIEDGCARTFSAELDLLYGWTHYRDGLLRAVGLTFRADATFGAETLLSLAAGPSARFYLMPDVFAIEGAILGEIGALTDLDPVGAHADLGVQLALIASIRRIEFALDLPRVSFLGDPRAERITLGLRVGYVF